MHGKLLLLGPATNPSLNALNASGELLELARSGPANGTCSRIDIGAGIVGKAYSSGPAFMVQSVNCGSRTCALPLVQE